MAKLKACPFCGGEAKLVSRYGQTAVWCKNCGAYVNRCSTNDEKNKEEAIAAWNNREDGS